MITFIICVKHYQNCHSYDDTWALLENTLVSVCNQTDENFDVIIVSNKTLNDFADSSKIKNVKFIEVGWDPPSSSGDWQIGKDVDQETGMNQIRIDRGTKYTLGLSEAMKNKRGGNHYVMFVDADDFIHEKLASYVNNENKDLYRIQKGFMLGVKKTYQNMDSFSQVCGTSNITKIELLVSNLNLTGIDVDSSQQEIIKTTDSHYLKMIIGSHKWSYDFFLERGYNGDDIPFAAAVYNCAHNEQHSGRENSRLRKKLTKDMIKSFSIKTS